jgi:type IV pilus assembly protein PilO
MTASRKWTVGTALVALLVLVAGWFLLIAPKRGEVADLEAQTAEQVSTNASLAIELEQLKAANKDLPEKQAELAALQTKIPETPDLTGYIRELQDIARQADVGLVSMTPAAAVTLGQPAGALGTAGLAPESLAAIDVAVVVEGDYTSIERFFNEMETTERYTLVGGYTIAEVEDTEDTSGVASAPLTATINARIYLVPTTPEGTTTTAPATAPTPAPTPATAS